MDGWMIWMGWSVLFFQIFFRHTKNVHQTQSNNEIHSFYKLKTWCHFAFFLFFYYCCYSVLLPMHLRFNAIKLSAASARLLFILFFLHHWHELDFFSFFFFFFAFQSISTPLHFSIRLAQLLLFFFSILYHNKLLNLCFFCIYGNFDFIYLNSNLPPQCSKKERKKKDCLSGANMLKIIAFIFISTKILCVIFFFFLFIKSTVSLLSFSFMFLPDFFFLLSIWCGCFESHLCHSSAIFVCSFLFFF